MERELIVSVIIPVYNAESTIHIALKSLIEQSYTKIEVVIIDDCSTDQSWTVIQKYIPILENKGMSTKVISHNKNGGVASARNTGLENATGEFIYYVDADDYLEINAIELLINEAVSKDADIVGCNWFLTFGKNERRMNQPSFASSKEAIQKMLNGSMRWNLWLFIVRRSLYVNEQIQFTPGMNMGEDMMVMVKLFTKATRVIYLDKALYHYGQSNNQSLTKIYSDSHIREVTLNVGEIERYLFNSRFSDPEEFNLNFLKLNIKLPLLISDQEEQYKLWLNWFPESNGKVMTNKALPFRTRFLQWLAVKKQFWAIKLYYRVVIGFIYGRVYK